MNYSFTSTVYMGDINLSEWAEAEGGGEPARVVLPGKPWTPGQLVLQGRGCRCGDPAWGWRCGWWQALLAQGELWLMAGGPDHPPERGPEAEWPQA